MVKTKEQNNAVRYQCEECGFWYSDQKVAEKCRAWCKEHKSCNLEIIKYAIKENGETSPK